MIFVYLGDDGYLGSSVNRLSTPLASDSSDLDEEAEEEEDGDDYSSEFEEDGKSKKKSSNTSNSDNQSNPSTSKHLSKPNKTATNAASKIYSFLDMTFWRK